jgi:dTDP-4-amino-4,6-dideoxygalactose transaminase
MRFTPKDEVIVPSWSWVASGFAPILAGATPVWCDVNEFGVPDIHTISKKMNNNTRAIIVVHQMGVPCDMHDINTMSAAFGIPVIEDAACAFGSEYKRSRIGDSKNLVTYSFQARKCLTTGEGGMIITKNDKYAEWLRSYRAFGTTVSPLERDRATFLLKESFDKIGGNYKISDITAAVGIAQLKSFDTEVEMRDKAGNYYNQLVEKQLKGQASPANIIPNYCTRYNWQNYHILLDAKYNRDQVVDLLRKKDIGCKWDIQAIHLEDVFGNMYEDESKNLPNTMRFHNSGLWLPFFAEITRKEQEYVIKTLKEVLNGLDKANKGNK